MTDKAKAMKEKLDIVRVSRDDWNMVCKDRLDFGFDSLYFRYAELCDELAVYKSHVNGTDPITERKNMNHRKMHFYNACEQLLHAHDQEERK